MHAVAIDQVSECLVHGMVGQRQLFADRHRGGGVVQT